MIIKQPPDFDDMDEALKILKDALIYEVLTTETIPNGVKIQGFEKGFWSKKLVYTLTVELIKDFPWTNLDPDFDDKYLKFIRTDRYGTSEFISNYGCLINAPEKYRKELIDDANISGYDINILSMALGTVKKYEEGLKLIEAFKNINH